MKASIEMMEAIEEFNEKLGSATEHNDIPRVRLVPVVSLATTDYLCRIILLLAENFAGQRCRKRVKLFYSGTFYCYGTMAWVTATYSLDLRIQFQERSRA